MTEVQEVLLELLDEIDTFCNEGHLKYFLGGEVALSAFRSGHFETETSTLSIFMTLPDVLCLQKLVVEKKNENRALESMYNNIKYPNLSFRYCSKNTLCINLNSDEWIMSPGIHINIKILRKSSHGRQQRLIRYLEHGWDYNYINSNTSSLSKKGKIVKNVAKVLLKISRETYRSLFLKRVELSQKNVSYNDKLFYETSKHEKKYFPDKMFADQSKVKLEGKSYSIPLRTSAYFKTLYGKKWAERTFITSESNDSKIVDPKMPYEKFLSTINRDETFSLYHKAREKEKEAKLKLKEKNNFINQAWFYVVRSGDRLNMWEKYSPQKEYIYKLYEEKNWDELKALFSEYDQKVQENAAHGLGLCFDRELFEIYRATLSHFGNKALADHFFNLVPDIHLKSNKIIS